MAKKPIFCFTHCDLDGAVTLLVAKWAYADYEVRHKALNSNDIRQDINQWMLTNNFDDFEAVFFLDLDMADCGDLIDHKNVIIIDHHKSHVNAMDYKIAKPFVKEYSSAALLSYRIFKKLRDIQFTEAQKILIIYANDYDSYTLAYPESSMLNVIFWNTHKSFETFINTFANGFKPFTKEQQAIYNIYEEDLKQTLSKLELYTCGHADVDGEYRVIMATFAEKYINDVSTYILDKYPCDVSIVINRKTKRVSFRRAKDGTMKLNEFAKDIAAGGGHEYSAGGQLDAFLEFSKNLKPYEPNSSR